MNWTGFTFTEIAINASLVRRAFCWREWVWVVVASGLAVSLLGAGVQAEGVPTLGAAPAVHPLVWDAVEKFARKEVMNQSTSFTFWVTNISTAAAAILHTESDCDCTVAKLPTRPWVLQPGESGPLEVKMNLLGRHGRVTKEIIVGTTHGGQTLKVHADIPLMPAPFNVSPRVSDRMAAQKDRQAVFAGGCAACHAWPAAGRTGHGLFSKACGICHASQHRASMVPDLAALKHPTDAEYWRRWIVNGKEGTMMPAFARSAGGILDADQIDSLVTFLVTNFPSKSATSLVPIPLVPINAPAAAGGASPSLPTGVRPPTIPLP